MSDVNNMQTTDDVANVDKTPNTSKKSRPATSRKVAKAAPASPSASDVKAKAAKKSQGGGTRDTSKAAGIVSRLKEQTAHQHSSPAHSDDIMDLMQLEEENRDLRRALAEKIRAENAELRRKLGL